jgi:hypothetical protein
MPPEWRRRIRDLGGDVISSAGALEAFGARISFLS